jgi:phosphatidylserine/phosphatidylglycerophosphate/cardiolipin synthase-like enzyme
MKNLLATTLLLSLSLWASGCGREQTAAALPAQAQPEAKAEGEGVDVLFSPRGGCTARIVAEINAARNSLYCQAYSFTSPEICNAIIAAHRRGVKVGVVLDRSQSMGNGSKIKELHKAGVPTWVDKKHAIAHNKVMIIDASVVITGSFNFTQAAENSNAENMLVIRSQRLAQQYMVNWTAHQSHSEKFSPISRR